jgi:hypothetical protein
VPEGISLIPAIGEDIERDLTANRESQTVICEPVFEFFDECSPDTVCLFNLYEDGEQREANRAHFVVHFEFIDALVYWEWVRPSVEETAV